MNPQHPRCRTTAAVMALTLVLATAASAAPLVPEHLRGGQSVEARTGLEQMLSRQTSIRVPAAVAVVFGVGFVAGSHDRGVKEPMIVHVHRGGLEEGDLSRFSLTFPEGIATLEEVPRLLFDAQLINDTGRTTLTQLIREARDVHETGYQALERREYPAAVEAFTQAITTWQRIHNTVEARRDSTRPVWKRGQPRPEEWDHPSAAFDVADHALVPLYSAKQRAVNALRFAQEQAGVTGAPVTAGLEEPPTPEQVEAATKRVRDFLALARPGRYLEVQVFSHDVLARYPEFLGLKPFLGTSDPLHGKIVLDEVGEPNGLIERLRDLQITVVRYYSTPSEFRTLEPLAQEAGFDLVSPVAAPGDFSRDERFQDLLWWVLRYLGAEASDLRGVNWESVMHDLQVLSQA